MIALDTNVWVRYVTNDDPVQARKALKVLRSNSDIFLPKTVLLEMEWVLRAVYGLPAASIERAMLQILGLPNVRPENPEQIAAALDLFRGGLEFADALHLAVSATADFFYTFDRKFIRAAKRLGQNVLAP
ncbi:MAG TPA: VapC toxin family PIN domain ribonuclease [Geobacter sp.]|nr:VapC toxin family PIN domain ribonuclease [Geobacter sp.]